jgi:hypothetical protein
VSPALRRHAGLGAQRVERGQRPLTHAGAVDREQLGDLVVVAPAPQDELEHGTLIGRKVVERGHSRLA